MEFDERDHLLGWMLTTMHRIWVTGMEHGFEKARPDVAAAARRWTARGLELQGWWLELGWIHFALEKGDGKEAWRLAAGQHTGYQRVLATLFHRLEAQTLQVRGAIMIAKSDPRCKEIAIARKVVANLEKVPCAWARGHAHCLRAGIASITGNEEEALDALRAAGPSLDEAGMLLMRTLVDDARGTLLGGDEGKALVTTARARLSEWRFDRDRAIACSLPGRW